VILQLAILRIHTKLLICWMLYTGRIKRVEYCSKK